MNGRKTFTLLISSSLLDFQNVPSKCLDLLFINCKLMSTPFLFFIFRLILLLGPFFTRGRHLTILLFQDIVSFVFLGFAKDIHTQPRRKSQCRLLRPKRLFAGGKCRKKEKMGICDEILPRLAGIVWLISSRRGIRKGKIKKKVSERSLRVKQEGLLRCKFRKTVQWQCNGQGLRMAGD